MLAPPPISDAGTERLRLHYQTEIDKAETRLAELIAEIDDRGATHSDKTRIGLLRNRIAKFSRGLRGERV